MKNLKLYIIDNNYIKYLQQFDSKVPNNKNSKRPYVGVVYEYNNHYYFAPLSSPKPKHLKIKSSALDIFKIEDGTLGVVNINNMLPVPLFCLTELLPKVKDKKYKVLLQNQLTFLNNQKKSLLHKVDVFYKQYINNYLNPNILARTCDFSKLEIKCDEFIKKVNKGS